MTKVARRKTAHQRLKWVNHWFDSIRGKAGVAHVTLDALKENGIGLRALKVLAELRQIQLSERVDRLGKVTLSASLLPVAGALA